ncbi:MAG: hypothetical protein ACFFCQ_13770 [Promethearchaeota archaeon]
MSAKINPREDSTIFLRSTLDIANPFDRFVSHREIRDFIDIPGPRKEAESAFFDALISVIRNRTFSKYVPIVGPAGSGKTHFFWYLKDLEEIELKNKLKHEWTVIYVPTPLSADRIYRHLLACILEARGINLFEDIWENLSKVYLGDRFSELPIDEALVKIVKRVPSDPSFLQALVIYGMDEKRRHIAERFLLGETLRESEWKQLEIRPVNDNEERAFLIIKFLSEMSSIRYVFYYDELETLERIKSTGELEQLAQAILQLVEESPGIIIITAALPAIWQLLSRVLLYSFIARESKVAYLYPFSEEEFYQFYKETMRHWWLQHFGELKKNDPYYPLGQPLLSEIHKKGQGNPRSCIRLVRDYIISHLSVVDRKITSEMIDIEDTRIVSLSRILGSMGTFLESLEHESIRKLSQDQTSAVFEIHGKPFGIEIASVKRFDKPAGISAVFAARKSVKALKDKIQQMILFVSKGTSANPKFQAALSGFEERIHVAEIDIEQAMDLSENRLMSPTLASLLEGIHDFLRN